MVAMGIPLAFPPAFLNESAIGPLLYRQLVALPIALERERRIYPL
jgi:hypothetical protein